MPTVTNTDLRTDLATSPDVTQTYFDKLLLMKSEYYMFHARWAYNRSLKHKQGRNIIFRRYIHLAQATAPLNEGEPPTGKTPTLDDFSATLQQNGDFIAISDIVEMTQQDPVLNEFTELLGEQAGYTMDSVDRDVAIAGTGNVIFSNGTARTQITTIIDGNDLERLQRSMKSNGAMMLLEGSGVGSANSNMVPVLPGYPCITDPSVEFDLQNVSGYVSAEKYKNGAGRYDGEVGRYRNLVFFVAPDPDSVGAGARIFAAGGGSSTTVDNTSGTVDVHTILAFGRQGFTHVPLDGESVRTVRKARGSAGTSDPLDQISTTGWIATTARLITNQSWIGRIECGASL